MESFDTSGTSISSLIDSALASLSTLTSYHIKTTNSTDTGDVVWYSDSDYVAPFSLYSKLRMPNMAHEREVLLHNGNMYNRVSDTWHLTHAGRPQPLSQRLSVGSAAIPWVGLNIPHMVFALVDQHILDDATLYEFAAERLGTTLTTLTSAGRKTKALQTGDHLHRVSLWIDPVTSYLHQICEYRYTQGDQQGSQTTTVFSRHNDVLIHVPLPSDTSC